MVNKKKEDKPLSGTVFRPKVVIDEIAAVPKEPGYTYKGVAMNFKHLPYNVTKHEQVGYEIVYSKAQMKDNRAFSPDSNTEDSMRLSPVIKTTEDGTQYLLMRITDEKFAEFMATRNQDDLSRYRKSLRKETKTGNSLFQDGGETSCGL